MGENMSNEKKNPMSPMSDEEIRELGRMTLHGSLPLPTVMRLFCGAIRVMDERDELKEELSRKNASTTNVSPEKHFIADFGLPNCSIKDSRKPWRQGLTLPAPGGRVAMPGGEVTAYRCVSCFAYHAGDLGVTKPPEPALCSLCHAMEKK